MERVFSEGFEPEEIDEVDAEIEVGDDEMVDTLEENVENVTLPGEDLLLAEIDAFRNKAAQLQQLINAKEGKAAELEALVREKEDTNQKLQEELAKRQEEANGIVTDVETQVDRILQSLKLSMDQIDVDVKDLIAEQKQVQDKQVNALVDSLNRVQSGIGEKTHAESVHLYRLIQDAFKEYDKADALAAKSTAEFKALKSFCTVLTVISALSLLTGVASLLFALGVL